MDWFAAPLHNNPAARARFLWLLRCLLIMDGLLLAGYVGAVALFWLGVTPRILYMLDIGSDRTLAEWANYLKWLACLILLWRAWRLHRAPVLLACLPVFLGILIDDAFQYHESRGPVYKDLLGLQPLWGLAATGVGQLIAFGLMGLVSALILGAGFAASAPSGRAIGLRFLALFAALILVGVGVDALHEAVAAASHLRYGGLPGIALTIVEEGGELVLASLAVAYCAGLVVFTPQASAAPPADRAAGWSVRRRQSPATRAGSGN
jgi:hypothetical protein